jgi:hypothetical protein
MFRCNIHSYAWYSLFSSEIETAFSRTIKTCILTTRPVRYRTRRDERGDEGPSPKIDERLIEDQGPT